jgi:hypothetical protein
VVTLLHAARADEFDTQRGNEFRGDGRVISRRPQRPVLGLELTVQFVFFDGGHNSFSLNGLCPNRRKHRVLNQAGGLRPAWPDGVYRHFLL